MKEQKKKEKKIVIRSEIGDITITALKIDKKKKDIPFVEISYESFLIRLYYGKLKPRKDYPGDFVVKIKRDRFNKFNHYVWSCDLIIKKEHNNELARDYINCLLDIWEELDGINGKPTYKKVVDVFNCYANKIFIKEFQDLSNYGYFNIEILSMLILLLAVQEKTNYPKAYRFKLILEDVLKEKIDVPQYVYDASGKR